MFCYPYRSRHVGLNKNLLIDLSCHVLIPNCAEYSTNGPPVTHEHGCCRDASFELWVKHSQSTQSL